MVRRACILAAVTACWSSAPATAPPGPPRPVTNAPTTADEYRGTLRIDAAPGAKHFQGVWLEREGARWILDYRARPLWRGFDGAEVIVTGHCYQPQGQAILATHFRVERLRLAGKPRGDEPYFEIGPVRRMTGAFVAHTYPAGSKLAGTTEIEFRADDGTTYGIAGSDGTPTPGPAEIRARVLEVNRAFSSTSTGPQIWIAAIAPGDDTADEPPAVPCT